MPARVPAVVLGLGINGLGTARALGRAGIPAIAITTGRHGPPERTRFARIEVCPGMSSEPGALVEHLVRLGRTFERPTTLFPSGDVTLHAVSAHRESLAPWYRFPFPSHELVELVLDKRRFYRWALEHGQPIAPTWFPRDPAALEATISILDALTAAGLPSGHAGVHCGPVIEREGDVFGRTVNLAARLADHAPDGAVYVMA